MTPLDPIRLPPMLPRADADLRWVPARGFAEALEACGAGGCPPPAEREWRANARQQDPAEMPDEAGEDPRAGEAQPGATPSPEGVGDKVPEPEPGGHPPMSPGAVPPPEVRGDSGPASGAKAMQAAPDDAAPADQGRPRLQGLPVAGLDREMPPRPGGAAADARAPRGGPLPAPVADDGGSVEPADPRTRPAGASRGEAAEPRALGDGERWLLPLEARRLMPGEQVRALERRWHLWETRSPQPARPGGDARGDGLRGGVALAGGHLSDPIRHPARAAAAPGLDWSRLLEQVSARMRLLAGGGEREAWLDLEPASLGRLQLKLFEAEGRWHLRLLVQRPETLELLRERLAELAETLGRQGLELGRVELALDPDAERRRKERESRAALRPEEEGATDFVEQLDRHLRIAGPQAKERT
jgi:hypothetical protein